MSHRRSAQFLRFACVGGVATGLQYLILVALVSGLGVGPALASGAGYSLSTLFNYAANRRITFRSQRDHASALPRFLAIAGCGLSLNTFIVWLLAQRCALHYLAAQIIASALALCWNFYASRRWAFAPPTEPL